MLKYIFLKRNRCIYKKNDFTIGGGGGGCFWINLNIWPEVEFKEFKPCRWTVKSRFQLSAGSYLETLNTIFKWNKPSLSRVLNFRRGSNSLNSASGGWIALYETSNINFKPTDDKQLDKDKRWRMSVHLK